MIITSTFWSHVVEVFHLNQTALNYLSKLVNIFIYFHWCSFINFFVGKVLLSKINLFNFILMYSWTPSSILESFLTYLVKIWLLSILDLLLHLLEHSHAVFHFRVGQTIISFLIFHFVVSACLSSLLGHRISEVLILL